MQIANYNRDSKADGAAFRLSEATYPAGLRQSAHEHEPASLSFVRKGTYSETFASGTRMRKPSTIVYRRPFERHAVDFHGYEVRIFRIDISPRWLRNRIEDPSILECSDDYRAGIIPLLCTRLYREFRQNDSSSHLAIEGLVLEMLAEISRQKVQSDRNPPGWLEQSREMLHANLAEPASLDAIAAAVGVHPVYLAREFRRHYRCTVGEYLRLLRIKLACRELSRAELPLSVIASNAGFYDQSHFSTTFKRYTGMTPSQYRSQRSRERKSRL